MYFAPQIKLGAVLLQFPFSFIALRKLLRTSRRCETLLRLSLVVEVRHGSWMLRTLELLRTSGVSFCNIDQPIHRAVPGAVGSGYLGRRICAASRAALRHVGSATMRQSPAHERYNYLYTAEELAPWVTRVHKVTERARETFGSSPTITSKGRQW